MPHRLSNTIKRAAFKAARPVRRQIGRALRHHATRNRLLAQWRQASTTDGICAWFRAFFSRLRVRANAHRFSLRTLLPKPSSALHALTARRAPNKRQGGTNRHPRRLAASASWFAFAAR